MAASIRAVARICVTVPANTHGQNASPGRGNGIPVKTSTPASRTSANGNPNRKRTWVAPRVPSVTISSRCMALRAVWLAAAMIVNAAQSHGTSTMRNSGGSFDSLRRPFRRDHVIHVHVVGELPAVEKDVVGHAALVDHPQPAALQHGFEFGGRDELVPPMRAARQPAQYIFGADDGKREALERAVEGRRDHQPAGRHPAGAAT